MRLHTRRWLGAIALLTIATSFPHTFALGQQAPAASEASEEATPVVTYAPGGIALGGADPVAYFRLGEPQAGRAEFAHTWGGVTWHFANADHRDLFAADPTAFAPQYGGYCAWAVSQGYKAPIDPNAWRIVDGKLYLNANRRIQQRWEQDIPGFITTADQMWPALSQS